jgi:phage replication-related protein YjqB (UPF0714/DUF867 family)
MSWEARMSTYPASIRQAVRPDQEELVTHPEHCSADPDRLATIGVEVGQQVRVRRTASRYGLYTVSETRCERPEDVVRMGAAGRRRLGISDRCSGVVDSQVPHPTFSERKARANNEFIERLADDGAQAFLIALAPHGGGIEPRTDRQAERVTSRLGPAAASSWRCKGWKEDGDPVETWHITSADLDERSFPLLASVIARGFTHAVAFHGFRRDEILVGGAARPEVKEEIRGRIETATADPSIPVLVAGDGDPFGGDEARNLVNRITASRTNGIQIEQSSTARSRHWRAIADAVADFYLDLAAGAPSDPGRRER